VDGSMWNNIFFIFNTGRNEMMEYAERHYGEYSFYDDYIYDDPSDENEVQSSEDYDEEIPF
jgi:hypothetical protein